MIGWQKITMHLDHHPKDDNSIERPESNPAKKESPEIWLVENT
jgi:hypothetical protein